MKDVLKAGANQLSVSIASAALTAKYLKNHHPYSIPTLANPGAFDVYNFARKPGSDFGWDWCAAGRTQDGARPGVCVHVA